MLRDQFAFTHKHSSSTLISPIRLIFGEEYGIVAFFLPDHGHYFNTHEFVDALDPNFLSVKCFIFY